MGWINNTTFMVTGMNNFTAAAFENAAKAFDKSILQRDLRGRVCLVTGANSGLGLELSKSLAKRGCTLYLVCRSEERGKDALEQVRSASHENRDVHLKICDLASLSSIASLCSDLDSKQTRLYLLINNAGLMLDDGSKSEDGFEVNFSVNTLGTFALTHRLQGCLERGGPGSRMVTITSGGAYTQPLVTEDLEMQKNKFDATAQYARDKRRQIAMTEVFAQQLQPRGVGCYLMHPGWTDTEGLRKSMPGFHKTFRSRLRSLEQGIDTVLWLALADFDSLKPGALYLDRQEQEKHLFMAGTKYAETDALQLWTKLCKMAGLQQASQLA